HRDRELVNTESVLECVQALIACATILYKHLDRRICTAITRIGYAGNRDFVRSTLLNVPRLRAISSRTRNTLSIDRSDVDNLTLAQVSGFCVMEGQNKTASDQSCCKNQGLKPQSNLSILTLQVLHLACSFYRRLPVGCNPNHRRLPGGAWGDMRAETGSVGAGTVAGVRLRFQQSITSETSTVSLITVGRLNLVNGTACGIV